MNEYSYKIELNVERDANNWWTACNQPFNHGVDWTAKMNQDVVKNIRGKSKDEAFKYLIPYLTKLYSDKEEEMRRNIEFIENEFKQKFHSVCNKVKEAMSGFPIYRNNFTIYLTTINRCPY